MKTMRENSHLKDKQIVKIEKILFHEKEKILGKDTHSEKYCLDKEELSDVLDEASANTETQKELRFRNRETFYLKKINKSLQKLKEGTYGICNECDSSISFARLSARPTAELCINCKEQSEVEENTNYYQKRSKSLGRTIAELGRA